MKIDYNYDDDDDGGGDNHKGDHINDADAHS